jgi:hypothetical protein
MIWDAVAGAIRAVSDNIVSIIKEFHLEPEKALQLEQAAKQAMYDFQKQIWELEDKDRASAREREAKMGDPTTRRLAYVYTGGYFGAFMALLLGWVQVQEQMKGLVDVLMGVLTAGQYSIMSYYFGSSHGSAQKDKTLDRIANHKEQ